MCVYININIFVHLYEKICMYMYIQHVHKYVHVCTLCNEHTYIRARRLAEFTSRKQSTYPYSNRTRC